MKHNGIVKNGKFIPDNAIAFKKDFYIREGAKVVVSIEPYRKKRSNDQNEYLWGVVYDLIHESSGHTPQEIHEIMKHKFLMTYTDIGDYARSTTKLSTVEFMDYVEKIRVWANDYNIYIPLPNEVDYEF